MTGHCTKYLAKLSLKPNSSLYQLRFDTKASKSKCPKDIGRSCAAERILNLTAFIMRKNTELM